MTKSKTPQMPNTEPINASDKLNILRNLLLKLKKEPEEILISKRGLLLRPAFKDSRLNNV